MLTPMTATQIIEKIEARISELDKTLDKADGFLEIARIMAQIRKYNYAKQVIQAIM